MLRAHKVVNSILLTKDCTFACSQRDLHIRCALSAKRAGPGVGSTTASSAAGWEDRALQRALFPEHVEVRTTQWLSNICDPRSNDGQKAGLREHVAWSLHGLCSARLRACTGGEF